MLFQCETGGRDLPFEYRALIVSVLVGSEYPSNRICRSSSLGLHGHLEPNDLSATLPSAIVIPSGYYRLPRVVNFQDDIYLATGLENKIFRILTVRNMVLH